MWRDIRHAIRALHRNPVFTAAAVLALGLAIGANATIFGLVDALWFRPPGVADPGRLVRIFSTTTTTQYGSWSFPEYEDLRQKTDAFDGVVARMARGTILRSPGGTQELLLVNVVSLNFFTTLGVTAEHGRLFAPDDQAALEASPGVVLSHGLWKRRFGSDPAIVGRGLDLGPAGSPFSVTVLGVLPASFRDLDAASDRDVWFPLTTWVLMGNRAELERRTDRLFQVIARRRSGVSSDVARAQVEALAAAMARDYPESTTGRGARVVADLLYRMEVGGVNALALLGLVLLVVLITCVNVANLLLARGAARSRELAVRVAIGATRGRLLRQLMTESLLLGAMGALAGLLTAMWLIRVLPALLTPPPGFRSFIVFQMDSRVILFTFAVTLLTTILFGIAPSWMAARTDVAPLIKGSGADPSRGSRGFVRSALATMQAAVSLVLLCAAGILALSFVATQRADLGFARKPILSLFSFGGDLPRATLREAERQLAALPAVEDVAVAIRAPLSLSGGGLASPVFVPDHPPASGEGLPQVKFGAVSTNYFSVMEIPLLGGRVFEPADESPGVPVIVVNERFATQFFPGGNALGSLVRIGGPTAREHRVVGIVRNTVINQVGEAKEPYFYLPYWRQRYGEITFLVSSDSDLTALAGPARDVLLRLDPRLQARTVSTLQAYIDYSSSLYQATAMLALALGGLGLLLTVIGVYGVMAYRTTRRMREFGIRAALGAARGQLLSMVLAEGGRVGLLGVVIGVPLALATTRLLSSLLFGVDPWHPPTFAGAAAVLLGAITAATLIPALRATRVDPSVALRDP